MMRRWVRSGGFVGLVLGMAGLVGCGGAPTGGLQGKVFVDGKPYDRGQLSFTPQFKEGGSGSCVVIDGKYKIESLKSGKYLVALQAIAEDTGGDTKYHNMESMSGTMNMQEMMKLRNAKGKSVDSTPEKIKEKGISHVVKSGDDVAPATAEVMSGMRDYDIQFLTKKKK